MKSHALLDTQIALGLTQVDIVTKKISLFHNNISETIYKIDAQQENLVLKVFSPSDYNTIQKEILLLQKLSRYYHSVITPKHKSPIMIGRNPSYIYRYFQGKRFSEIAIPDKYFTFGTIVAEFDVALKKLYETSNEKQPKNPFWIPKRRYPNLRLTHLTSYAVNLFEREIRSTDFKKIRAQYVHKDLHFYNVIYNKSKRSHCIIDTNGISVQYLPREISVCVGNVLTDSFNRFSKKRVTDIMRGYSTLIKLSKAEKKAIPLFIIQKKLGEIDYLYKQLKLRKNNVKVIKKHIHLSQKVLSYTTNRYDDLVDFFSNIS